MSGPRMEATVAAAALEAAQVAAEFMQRRGAQRSWAPTRSRRTFQVFDRYLHPKIYIQKFNRYSRKYLCIFIKHRFLIDIYLNIYGY